MSDTQRTPTPRWIEPVHLSPLYDDRPAVATMDTAPQLIVPPPSYQTLTTAAAVPTLQQTQAVVSDSSWRESCKRSALLQAISGFLFVGLGFVCVALDSKYSDTGVAIWSGIWIIFSASLGISSVRHPGNICVVTTYMLFSFFSVVSAVMVASISGAAVFLEDAQNGVAPYAVRVAVDAILAFVATMEIFFAIAGCILASKKAYKDHTRDTLIRRNYYVSHLSNNDIITATSPSHYHPDSHPFQVLPQYSTFESPPPYEATTEDQSQIESKKNTENGEREQ